MSAANVGTNERDEKSNLGLRGTQASGAALTDLRP